MSDEMVLVRVLEGIGEVKANLVAMHVTLEGILREDVKRNGRIERIEARHSELEKERKIVEGRSLQRKEDKAKVWGVLSFLNDWKSSLPIVLAGAYVMGRFGIESIWTWFL